MPRGACPPTPAPSTDIVGKDSIYPTNAEKPLTLPPSAMSSRSSSSGGCIDASGIQAPPSPSSPQQYAEYGKKTRAALSTMSPTDVTLPPPPTRSCKIIQMKPEEFISGPATVADAARATTAATGKRKQGATTSAGRRIARKTAHSIIERRRRSKMNEEFGVLKDMIPACTGQEMHKLAILQASIEYLRYLEQCVADLQAGRNQQATSAPSSRPSEDHSTPMYGPSTEDDEDEEMEDTKENEDENAHEYKSSTIISPQTLTTDHKRQHSQPPPNLYASNSTQPSPGFSVSNYRHYHHISSIELPLPQSPFSQPPQHFSRYPSVAYTNSSGRVSQNPSPLILSQVNNELDHEASAALLMLNATDRRLGGSVSGDSKPSSAGLSDEPRWRTSPVQSVPPRIGSSGMKRMSVQDLLRN